MTVYVYVCENIYNGRVGNVIIRNELSFGKQMYFEKGIVEVIGMFETDIGNNA